MNERTLKHIKAINTSKQSVNFTSSSREDFNDSVRFPLKTLPIIVEWSYWYHRTVITRSRSSRQEHL